MYLSPQQMALADQAITETFQNCSIAWQAIPHWDTGDPGATKVRNDVVNAPSFIPIAAAEEAFQVTLVQTADPTSDALVNEIISATTALAAAFDDAVLDALASDAISGVLFIGTQQGLLDALIDARAHVEDNGFRAPSCLITNTAGLKLLSALTSGYPIVDSLLGTAHVNSMHRTSKWNVDVPAVKADGSAPKPPVQLPMPGMILLGRRQLIPHGGAYEASPGEEPVDLAVCVKPSLEILGETTQSQIEMSVRIRYALRVKDRDALAVLLGAPVVS
ncbi:hypothetical protein FK535_09635 [Mycolicibacterium sp. 018/SC-01/001]|uniref:hypothetical protein n=1 Tax=Mycolicibacterium sp. 018/SC-01/001 TaxID=2592069 RepID=UPI00117FA317|nr:hypothetical protein [Mycolicibacterium sp. 018/SC-01/001]TRW84745.1 hypothetical protein FK535_09635 [Mycolicibacterium sp. 018/SC-01/001]